MNHSLVPQTTLSAHVVMNGFICLCIIPNRHFVTVCGRRTSPRNRAHINKDVVANISPPIFSIISLFDSFTLQRSLCNHCHFPELCLDLVHALIILQWLFIVILLSSIIMHIIVILILVIRQVLKPST